MSESWICDLRIEERFTLKERPMVRAERPRRTAAAREIAAEIVENFETAFERFKRVAASFASSEKG
jgi:hypothetical protein